jgi:glycosyltransferase involved in cell wall biosynthesis
MGTAAVLDGRNLGYHLGVNGRIRVVRVIARMNVGGPAVHVALLTERLDPTRYSSWLVTGREGPGEGNYLDLHHRTVPGLTVVPDLERRIRGYRDVRALVGLLKIIRRHRPHIVHTHTAKAGVIGRLAARLAGVPVVVHTYHGHVFHGYFSPAQTKRFVAIERLLARWTDRLLAVSVEVRSDLLALGIGPADRVSVMPLGLDLDALVESGGEVGRLRRELAVPADELLVGIVARLVPIKAHEVFLAAAARLAGSGPPARFVIVGDGERRAELERLARGLGIESRVHFLGWRADLARIYADLDLVVLTSRNEGSPVSIIEALAAARPVVATRVGGVADLIEDGVNGCLVEADDVPGLSQRMQSVLRDPEQRRRLGEAGRKSVYPAFGAQRLLGDMDTLYTELLRNRRGRGWTS